MKKLRLFGWSDVFGSWILAHSVHLNSAWTDPFSKAVFLVEVNKLQLRNLGFTKCPASKASHKDSRRQVPTTIEPLKITGKITVLDRAPNYYPPSLGVPAMASLHKAHYLLDGPDGVKASY